MLMHELKFVYEIIKNLEKVKTENNFIKIQSVELLVGEFSGIEERALIQAFEMATLNSIWQATKIKCVIEPLMVQCLECNNNSKIIDFNFVCDYCRSRDVKEVAGKGLFIKAINGVKG
jgi:hydrogenase nickel incorporation protein HypA/HybF